MKKKTTLNEAVSASFQGTTDVPSNIKAAIKKDTKDNTKNTKTQEEVIKAYCDTLKGSIDRFKQAVAFLTNSSYRISGLIPKDIVLKMKEKEVNGEHRSPYLTFLEESIRLIGRKQPGELSEDFDPNKHMSLNKSYGPDYTKYKKVMDELKKTKR